MSITFKKYCGKKKADLFRSIGCNVVKLDNIWDDPTGSMPYDITIHGNQNEFQKTIDKFNTHEEPLYVNDLSINDFDIENFVTKNYYNNVSKINSYFDIDQIAIHNCKIKYLSYQVKSHGYFINCNMKGVT